MHQYQTKNTGRIPRGNSRITSVSRHFSTDGQARTQLIDLNGNCLAHNRPRELKLDHDKHLVMSLELFYHVCERKDNAKCHNTIFSADWGMGVGGGGRGIHVPIQQSQYIDQQYFRNLMQMVDSSLQTAYCNPNMGHTLKLSITFQIWLK